MRFTYLSSNNKKPGVHLVSGPDYTVMVEASSPQEAWGRLVRAGKEGQYLGRAAIHLDLWSVVAGMAIGEFLTFGYMYFFM